MVYVNTSSLSKDILKALAMDIFFMGASVCNNLFEEYQGKIKLAETFPLYMLNMDKVEAYNQVLSVVDDIGYHHQILFDKQALAFAISRLSKRDGAIEIVNFSRSKLAKAIDETITFIENEDKKSTLELEVRLLKIPAQHLHAFWLLKKVGEKMQTESLLFINCGLYDREIPCHRFLEEKEFINILINLPSIIGVPEPKK